LCNSWGRKLYERVASGNPWIGKLRYRNSEREGDFTRFIMIVDEISELPKVAILT
jgi:hypothetical protein